MLPATVFKDENQDMKRIITIVIPNVEQLIGSGAEFPTIYAWLLLVVGCLEFRTLSLEKHKRLLHLL